MPRQHEHKGMRTLVFCKCGATSTDGGDWESGKDPHAVALAAKAIAMTTHEERSAKGTTGGHNRWKGKSSKERKEFMSWMASQPRPGRRNEDRCECGRFTREQAEKRNHLCGKSLNEKLEEASNGR